MPKQAKEPGVGRGGWTRPNPRKIHLSIRVPPAVLEFYDNGTASATKNIQDLLEFYSRNQTSGSHYEAP